MWVGEAGREPGKREQHSRNSMCKGPEAGRLPGPQRKWKEARVTGAQRKGVWWAWNLEARPTGPGGHSIKTISLDCKGPEE